VRSVPRSAALLTGTVTLTAMKIAQKKAQRALAQRFSIILWNRFSLADRADRVRGCRGDLSM
jgi:hypothetical protein